MTKRAQRLLEVISRADVTVYEVLTPTNLEEAKAAFLANRELEAPTFRYEKLDSGLVDENLEVLLNVQAEIFPTREDLTDRMFNSEAVNFSEAERQLLQMCWWDVYHKNSLLRAVLDYHEARKRERKNLQNSQFSMRYRLRQEECTRRVAKRFYRLNEDAYSKPDEVTYRGILSRQLDKIDSVVRKAMDETADITPETFYELFSDVQKVKGGEVANYERTVKALSMLKVACELDYRLKDIKLPHVYAEANYHEVSLKVVQKFTDLVNDKMQRFWQYVPSNHDEFTAQEMCEILQQILARELAGKTAFRVELVSNRSALSVDQLARVIQVPKNLAKGNYTPTQMRAMLGHELGTHVMRGVPFENSPVRMLSTGLPHYEEFEEGLAKCVEQVIKGEIGPTGEDHYRNIGLAYFDEKDFREVFEIGWRILYLKDWKLEHDAKKCAERWGKCRDLAFTQTMRCFRGTGELVNFKDLMYYNGTQRAWRYISEHIDDEPDELWQNLFGMGKTDQMREDHMRLVREVMMV